MFRKEIYLPFLLSILLLLSIDISSYNHIVLGTEDDNSDSKDNNVREEQEEDDNSDNKDNNVREEQEEEEDFEDASLDELFDDNNDDDNSDNKDNNVREEQEEEEDEKEDKDKVPFLLPFNAVPFP